MLDVYIRQKVLPGYYISQKGQRVILIFYRLQLGVVRHSLHVRSSVCVKNGKTRQHTNFDR